MNRIKPKTWYGFCSVMLIMLLFAACGSNNDVAAPTPTPAVSVTPSPTPLPIITATPAPEYAAPAENMRTLQINDGVRQFAITIDIPKDLQVWHSDRFGGQGRPILFNEGFQEDETDDHFVFTRSLFEFSEGTGHLDSWQIDPFGGNEGWTGMMARHEWTQPGAPADVFTTNHGITVVHYVSQFDQWGGWDATLDEVRAWDWSAGTPDPLYVPSTINLYFFRADGRDVRSIDGAQIFYYIITFTIDDLLDEMNTQTRDIIESIRFGDPPPITLTPTAAAQALGIDGTNYPRINGSTSTIPLVQRIFMEMFEPTRDDGGWMWDWEPYWISGAARTIPAYELLIANYVDLILVPDPSEAALALAAQSGVALEFTPVAMEALVFITSGQNPVSNITKEQVIQIYSEMSITNWQDLGGEYGRIIPLNRNPHSGSQTLFDNMILRERSLHDDIFEFQVGGMLDMLSAINNAYVLYGAPDHDFTLGYTVYFFLLQQQAQWEQDIKVLDFEGITPSNETFKSGEYPLTTHYFAVIRADAPEDSPARIIKNWLISNEGQDAVERATLGRLPR